VPGMKFYKCSGARFLLQHLPPPVQGEDTFNEILPQMGIVKPSLFFHGNERKVVHEGFGKNTHPFLTGMPFSV